MPALKKSQITFFAIIGLVMLIAAVLGFVVYNNIIKADKISEETKKASELSFQAEEIKKLINDCIRKSSFEGLTRLGITGGYIDVPKLLIYKTTSFWYLEQVNVQPFLNQTQERLIDYINLNIPECIDNENVTKFGFEIDRKQPLTLIEYGSNDITIKVNYPIKLHKQDFTKDYTEFFNTFNLRYRSVFEAATEVNKRIFDADFDISNPLKKVEYIKNLDFDIIPKIPEIGIMTFTLVDKKSITPKNEFYAFTFAAKFGNSTLKKITEMQKNSATNPTFLPYTIHSVDNKAQLDISQGTTISLNSSDVEFISVQQNYPAEVFTSDVPTHKITTDKGDERSVKIEQRQNIQYTLDNPVYTFEPSGLIFNNPEKLTIYYDDDTKNSKGVGILMGKNGFWVPIASKHEKEQKRVYTNIFGFTEFTAVYCASQELKKTISEHFFEPSGSCYVKLGLIVVVVIVLTIVVIGTGGSGVVLLQAIFSLTKLGAAFLSGIGLGTTVITATTAALVGLGIATLTIGTVAMTIQGSDTFYEQAPENCQTFYPTCDQTIIIQKEQQDGKGKCIPEGTPTVNAGQPANVCAFVKKCNTVQKFLCIPCSVKCTATFY